MTERYTIGTGNLGFYLLEDGERMGGPSGPYFSAEYVYGIADALNGKGLDPKRFLGRGPNVEAYRNGYEKGSGWYGDAR